MEMFTLGLAAKLIEINRPNEFPVAHQRIEIRPLTINSFHLFWDFRCIIIPKASIFWPEDGLSFKNHRNIGAFSRMLASEKRISNFDGINDGAMLLGELKVDNVIGSLCNTEKRSKQKSSK